jgi:hypothetical protein
MDYRRLVFYEGRTAGFSSLCHKVLVSKIKLKRPVEIKTHKLRFKAPVV